MSQICQPQPKTATSNKKTQSSNSKQLLSNRSTNPSRQLPFSTPSLHHHQHHTNSNQNQNLLKQCYNIISAQQAHIRKLQRENQRKDRILGLRKGNWQIGTDGVQGVQEVEKLGDQVRRLWKKYDKVVRDNQIVRAELEQKNMYICKMAQYEEEMKARERELKEQLQECKESVLKLKKVYEAKITTLLQQLRSNIEKDIKKSKYNIDTNLHLQIQDNTSNKKLTSTSQWQGTPQKASFQTDPQKNVKTAQKQKSTQYIWQGSTELKGSTSRTSKKMLQNDPYKSNHQQFIYSTAKAFPPSQAENDGKQGMWRISDTHFEESYSSQVPSSVNQSKISNREEQEYVQSAAVKKIPLQQLIKNFSDCHETQINSHLHKKSEIYSDEAAQDSKRIQSKKQDQKQYRDIKWHHIIDQLRKKIKKFQNPNLPEFPENQA